MLTTFEKIARYEKLTIQFIELRENVEQEFKKSYEILQLPFAHANHTKLKYFNFDLFGLDDILYFKWLDNTLLNFGWILEGTTSLYKRTVSCEKNDKLEYYQNLVFKELEDFYKVVGNYPNRADKRYIKKKIKKILSEAKKNNALCDKKIVKRLSKKEDVKLKKLIIKLLKLFKKIERFKYERFCKPPFPYYFLFENYYYLFDRKKHFKELIEEEYVSFLRRTQRANTVFQLKEDQFFSEI